MHFRHFAGDRKATPAALRLGIGFAEELLKGVDLHLTPFEELPLFDRKIADVQKDLGLVKSEKWAYFRSEEILILGSRATRRLDCLTSAPMGHFGSL